MFNAFLQWLNQTYNCGVNYGNRNASSCYTLADVGKGYAGAVFASISIAVVTRRLFAGQLARFKGSKLILLNAFLNFIAAAFPGMANLTIMRMKELSEGIEVQNADGTEVYGKSVAAGKSAIMQTAASRAVLPTPIFAIPAGSIYLIHKMKMWPKSKTAGSILELFLVTASLMLSVPMSVALFQQYASLDRS